MSAWNTRLVCQFPTITHWSSAHSPRQSEDRNIKTGSFRLLLGQKFPSKTLEASLNAIVHFGEKRQQVVENQPMATGFNEDPFCTGINSYAQVCERGKVL